MIVYIRKVPEGISKKCQVCGKATGDYYTKATSDHKKHLIATFRKEEVGNTEEFEAVEFNGKIHAKLTR